MGQSMNTYQGADGESPAPRIPFPYLTNMAGTSSGWKKYRFGKKMNMQNKFTDKDIFEQNLVEI
jgi:hypothetical protein